MIFFQSFKYTPLHSKSVIILFSVLIIIIFLYNSLQVLGTKTYPLYSDEYEYSKNTENFVRNHTLSSALTLDEKYSKIGNFSFHGFSYTAIYGSLASILHTDNLVIINISLSFFALLFILLIKELSLFSRLRLIALVISYGVFFLYTFSYMVESIHLFLSIILTYLIYKYIVENAEVYKWIIIVTLLSASFLRQTWFVYMFSIFFQTDMKNRLISNVLIFLTALLVVITGMYLFYASYENSFIYHLLQDVHNIYGFFKILFEHFVQNLQLYFFNYVNSFYYFSKIGLFWLLLASFYYGVKEKNRFLLSISFIGWCYFLLLLLLYNATAWRELRILGVVYISLLVALSMVKKHTILNIFFMIQLILFPNIIEYYNNTRTIFYQQPLSAIQKQKIAAYKSLSYLIQSDIGKEVLIIIDNGLLTLNYNRALDSLPLKAKDGTVFKYSIGYFSKFTTKKTKGDYLLTQKKYQSLHLLAKNNFFNLYKIGKEE